MGYKVFKNILQGHYMLEIAEEDTGQLLLVSDMCCGSQLLLVKLLLKGQSEPTQFLLIWTNWFSHLNLIASHKPHR